MNLLKQLNENKMKNHKTFYYLIVIAAALLMIFLSAKLFLTDKSIAANNDSNNEFFPQDYRIISPKIPDHITIFGEDVPLDNFEVYERVEREILVNTYWHSATILAIKRAARWFPVIEPILKQNNIPDDFKYLAVVESNLDNVVSPAGATLSK